MPGDDVEILRNAYDALNRGDVSAALAVVDEQAVWEEHSELPEAGAYRGRETIRTFLESFLESWQEFHQEAEEFIARESRVLIFLRLVARGKGSGIPVETRYAHLWTMREGSGVRVDAYYDTEEALAALGAQGER
jgi:ketosteroid isomerase-like protein